MKVRLLLFFTLNLWIFSSNSAAQNTLVEDVQFEDDNARISTFVVDCIDRSNGTAKQYISIEILNKTDGAISVSFKREMWYDGKCFNCNSNSLEFNSVVFLESNEVKSGNCGKTKDLLIFLKMLELQGVSQLTHLDLKNINVQKL